MNNKNHPFTFITLKLFQEPKTKNKYNKRCPYCSDLLGNNKGLVSYEPGTTDEDQNIYFFLYHSITDHPLRFFPPTDALQQNEPHLSKQLHLV